MYDDLDRSWREPWSPVTHHRLAHLVLVDGRLVDAWTEPVEGTRWQDEADRIDRARRPVAPPDPPAPPEHERVLAWLREVCGGAEALARLGTDPLVDDGSALAETLDAGLHARMVEARELLDAVAHALFGREAGLALRRAVVALCVEAPETALSMTDSRQLAVGVCWVVAKANGLFDATAGRTQARVKDVLGWSGPMPSLGRKVEHALHGPAWVPHPHGLAPDLLPVGRPELLVSATRRQLVRLRDRAEAARESAA